MPEMPKPTLVPNPEQRFVPVDWNGDPIAGCRRHLYDCSHFYEKKDRLTFTREELRARLDADPNNKVSFVEPASPEQMRSIDPCNTCGVVTEEPTLIRTCPKCHMSLPATGVCDCG